MQVLIHTQLPTGVGAGEVKQPGGVLPLEDALYTLVRFACMHKALQVLPYISVIVSDNTWSA